MNELLDYIGGFSGASYYAAFLVGILIFRQLNSFTITAFFVSIFEYIEQLLDPRLFELAVEYKSTLPEADKWLGLFVWYGVWAILSLMKIISIFQSHKLFGLSLTPMSRKIAFMCLALCGVQVFRYIDRLLLLDIFGSLYQIAIPTLKISIGIMLITFLLQHIWWRHHYGHAN